MTNDVPVNKEITVNDLAAKKSKLVTLDTLLRYQKMSYAAFSEQWRSDTQQAILLAEAKRQATEDVRANHRNFNRLLTLMFALLAGLVVTYVLTSGTLGSFGKTLGPYSFVITVMLDSSLALYSLIRRY